MSAHGFSIYFIAGTYAGSRVIKVPERNLTADVDAMLARGVAGDAADVPGQSEQPHRHRCCRRTRWRGCVPPCRPRCCWCWTPPMPNTSRAPDYDAGREAGRCHRQHGDDPHVLEGVRPGRHAHRLVLCAAGGGGRAEPGARAVQRLGGGTGGGDRGAGRARLGGERPRPQRRMAPEAGGRPGAAGIKVWPSEGNFVLADFGDAGAGRGRRRLPAPARHHRARRARLRPAALPAHHRRHCRGGAGGDRCAAFMRGTCMPADRMADPLFAVWPCSASA